MKLLVDENISFRVVTALEGAYPDSCHVKDVGLSQVTDLEIWNYARTQGFTIVTKDLDFLSLSVLHGAPPKVVHLALGNCSTEHIIQTLLAQQNELLAFEKNTDESIIEVTSV